MRRAGPGTEEGEAWRWLALFPTARVGAQQACGDMVPRTHSRWDPSLRKGREAAASAVWPDWVSEGEQTRPKTA